MDCPGHRADSGGAAKSLALHNNANCWPIYVTKAYICDMHENSCTYYVVFVNKGQTIKDTKWPKCHCRRFFL